MNDVYIDLATVPESKLSASFRVLRTEINRLLSTPEGKADYEKWKKERTENYLRSRNERVDLGAK